MQGLHEWRQVLPAREVDEVLETTLQVSVCDQEKSGGATYLINIDMDHADVLADEGVVALCSELTTDES